MKPTLKTEFIVLEYWDCGVKDHRHKTKEVSAACIARQEKSIRRVRWTNDLYLAVLNQYRNGTTMKELAEKLSLSTARIWQIVARAKRLEERLNKEVQ